MDAFEEYMNKDNKIVSILKESKSARECIEKINNSDLLYLDRDFETICLEMKIIKPKFLQDIMKFLLDNNKRKIITNNVEIIGIQNFFDFTIKSGDKELTEYMYSNFRQLLDKLYSTEITDVKHIKLVLEKGEERPEVKESIPSIIRNLDMLDRIEIIDLIKNSKELGKLEDYLEDFLYIKKGNFYNPLDLVISCLVSNNVNKTELLGSINRNINDLLNCYNKCETNALIRFIDLIVEIENSVPEKTVETQKMISKIYETATEELPTLLEKHNYNADLINTFRKFGINKATLKENQNSIIDNNSGSNLIKYIEQARNYEGFDKEWDSCELTKQIFKNGILTIDSTLEIMISKLIQEICEHEGIKPIDVEFAGKGFYSFNIKIGSYVIKIGEERFRNYIPNDKRIIKPLIRQQTNIKQEPDRPNLFIEIQNAVDAKWYEGLEEESVKEELYKIYCELRSRGKIWTDIKPENVGRLLRPNKENFRLRQKNKSGELEECQLNSTNYAVSFTEDKPDEILQKGELVIIDTDYIFEEKKGRIYSIPNRTYYKEFRERYDLEHQREEK